MLMGMSLVAHARFVPLHPHDKYLTFIVNGMRFDENNPYIIRECIVQVLYARSSCPHKCPFPRRTRRSPNHLPRVVDVQSSAKVPPGSTPRFCISVALLHRNARTPRGPFEYPTTSPALLIAVASLEVSPGNVPRLRTLADFRPQNCTIAAYGFHRSHDLIRVIDVASFAITAARQSTEILNARPCRPQESFYAIRT